MGAHVGYLATFWHVPRWIVLIVITIAGWLMFAVFGGSVLGRVAARIERIKFRHRI